MLGIRKIINSDKLKTVIDIPDELKDQKVEVIVLPLIIEKKRVSVKKEKRFLKLFSNPVKVKKLLIPSREEMHER